MLSQLMILNPTRPFEGLTRFKNPSKYTGKWVVRWSDLHTDVVYYKMYKSAKTGRAALIALADHNIEADMFREDYMKETIKGYGPSGWKQYGWTQYAGRITKKNIGPWTRHQETFSRAAGGVPRTHRKPRKKNPSTAKGYTKFHGNPPAKGWEVRVPDCFPKKLWLLGDHHRTVLADGSVLTGGLVCASSGNAIFLTGVKGNGMRGKKSRVNQIEYTPRKDSNKHGPTYYHPYKTPPTITKVQKGFYIIRGTRQKLTSRGIIG